MPDYTDFKPTLNVSICNSKRWQQELALNNSDLALIHESRFNQSSVIIPIGVPPIVRPNSDIVLS